MFLASLPRSFARHVFALCAGLLVTTAVLFAQATPSAADGFAPDVDGNVYAVAAQPDGKLVIGGQFAAVRGVARNNLARINPDGSLDVSFNPNANGPVRAIVLQSDNRIVIGGDFTTLQPGGAGAEVSRSRVARLEANGAVEPAFNPNLGGALKPQVHALLLQPDGRIVIGGSFDTVHPAAPQGAPSARSNLARFSTTGALDAAFAPNPNATVLALAQHVDNKIVVAGGFTAFQPAGDPGPTTRNRIARLNPNGALDTAFDPNVNNGITALAVQRDGKILLGGFFTTLQPPNEEAAVNRARLARLNLDGTLDHDFSASAHGDVSALALQQDGSLLVGGLFTSVSARGSGARNQAFVARFRPDGSLDDAFAPSLNAAVDAFAPQSDGKVVIAGHFTRALPRDASNSVVRNHLARLEPDGSLDTDFAIDPGGRILASVTQTDGKVVVAGTFTNLGGATHNYVARLNANGSIDATYNPSFDAPVYALAYDPGANKVIAGGAFAAVNGQPRGRLARLGSDGTPDADYNPNLNGQVGVLLRQSDGKILVGGAFTTAQPIGATSATNRANLLRLETNGTLDTGFDPSPNSAVSALALQPDGKILVGGLFTALTPGFGSNTSASTTARNFFARINADGTLDTAFAAIANGQVSAIVVQPGENKIVIGGVFTGVALPGDRELTTRNRIARFNADGTIDAAYNPNANGNILAAAVLADGKAIIGGAFTTLQPTGEGPAAARRYIARLNTDGSVDPAFDLDLDQVSGNRVDSLRLADSVLLVGGAFASLQPLGTPMRIERRNFARLLPTGAVDPAFDPASASASNTDVAAFAVQPDGKTLAVGLFSDLGGARTTNIARYLPEGGADPDFNPTLATDGRINAVIVRPNATPVVSPVSGFAWLDATGKLRPAFNPTARLAGEVSAIAVQPDGRVILGGAFANLSNTTSGNLARFTPAGVLDTSFDPAPNGAIAALALQTDGKLILAGTFTTVHGVARNRIARLNSDGSLDTGFDPNANGRIDAIAIEDDDQILIGGAFTSLTPNGETTAVTRNYLARLNPNGSVDANYNPGPNFRVNALALHTDGAAIVGGAFASFQPPNVTTAITRNGIARIGADGAVDQNFNPNANAPVHALAVLPGGQVLVGGEFSTFQPNATGDAIERHRLARLQSDGTVDSTFDAAANATVTSLVVDSTGDVLIGGEFTTLRGTGSSTQVSRNRLARLNSDGSLDLGFNPGVNGAIATVVASADGGALVGGNFTRVQIAGSIWVGGNFATIGGIAAKNLASLNDNGSVDPTFQPQPDGQVNAMLVQPDGKVIVGGGFSSIGGAPRSRLARFNPDGTLDSAFNPSVQGLGTTVLALSLQADGKVLVGIRNDAGGPFGGSMIRLNADGTSDSTFAGLSSATNRIAVQPDGRILFTTINGVGRLNADGTIDASFPTFPVNTGNPLSFALQADGRIVAGGMVALPPSPTATRLVRVNANGSLDPSFDGMPNEPVSAIALRSDGRILAGGQFTRIGGQPRVGLARLAATSPGIQLLGVSADRTRVIFQRAGTTAEASAIIFEQSLDRLTWTRLGVGTRVPNSGADWHLPGVNLPASGLFYLRARAIIPTGNGTSSGIFETIREFNYANPVVPPSNIALQTPAQAAAQRPGFDPGTGIAPRSVITMVPGEGALEIFAGPAPFTPDITSTRLANLSTRGRVTADNPLILGFAISGSDARRVLVRAIGPSLAGFGVGNALPATRLQVYDAAGALVASNEGWAGAPDLAQAAAETGAFPLTSSASPDSAALLTLTPGNYTVQVVDARGAGGVGLAEIYDADRGAGGSRLINVSSRGAAGAGGDALISGFVIAGGENTGRVLLRGVGPGLAKFGLAGAVSDPAIALYNGEGLPLGANDNWVSSVADISLAAASAGAFALDPGSKDAAVLANLPTGAYTIQVSAGTTGSALLEIYEVR